MGVLSLTRNLILVVLGLLCLGACSSLMYHPQKAVMIYDPKRMGLEPEDVFLVDQAGRTIHGWYFKSKLKDSKATVVFFHGNAENISSHFVALSWLPDQGYNYFIFDYPGYGASEGEPTPQSTVESGRAALKWVQANKESRPLVVYAHSLGGNIGMRSVLDVRTEVKFAALIVDGSFPSYQRIGRQKLSTKWFLWPLQPLAYLVLSNEYSPKKISDLSPIPLLVMHGQKDVVVEPNMGEEIFEQAAQPKEIWRIPDGHHGDNFYVENQKYRGQLLTWISERIAKVQNQFEAAR